MSTPTVRIRAETLAIAKELARELSQNEKPLLLHDVLDKAILFYRKHAILAAADAAYQSLRNDPVAWQQEVQERVMLDNLLQRPPVA